MVAEPVIEPVIEPVMVAAAMVAAEVHSSINLRVARVRHSGRKTLQNPELLALSPANQTRKSSQASPICKRISPPRLIQTMPESRAATLTSITGMRSLAEEIKKSRIADSATMMTIKMVNFGSFLMLFWPYGGSTKMSTGVERK
jgi:hypothetical protein